LWWGLPPVPPARVYIERVMDALQRAIPTPEVEIGPYRALRRQVFGQRLPLAQSTARRKIPFKISRTSVVRLRPTCLAGGIMGSTIAHHDEGGRGSEKIPLRSSCSCAVSHTNAPLGRASRRWPGKRAFDAAN